jgi:hypothetical protein
LSQKKCPSSGEKEIQTKGGEETECLVKKKRRRLLAPEMGYSNLLTEAA